MPAYRRAMLAAAATTLALVGVPASAGAQAVDAPKRYVALGDSYAAGPRIPDQRNDPSGCERSTNNYPARFAQALSISDYTDVTCSGATTENMTSAQSVPGGPNAAQFSALRPDTDLVTVTISGNDIGFTDIVLTCTRVSVRDPMGNPCQRQANAGGTDAYAERIEAVTPKVAAVLDGIHERAPHATVLLVGYLRILPPSVGCYPVFPVARGDVPYLDGLEQQLTSMLDSQAFRHDAVFVNTYQHSLAHDVCQPAKDRWVEGMVPSSPAAQVHPNAAGMQAVAELAREVLRNHNESTTAS